MSAVFALSTCKRALRRGKIPAPILRPSRRPPRFERRVRADTAPDGLRRHHHCMITTWPPTLPNFSSEPSKLIHKLSFARAALNICTVVKPAFIKASIKRLMCACTTWPTPMKWMQSAIRMRYEDEIIAAAVLTVQYWTRESNEEGGGQRAA